MGNMQMILNQFQQFKSNPIGYMMQNRIRVPQEIAGDPGKIIQHLMNDGKITQNQYAQASEMAKRMRGIFGA